MFSSPVIEAGALRRRAFSLLEVLVATTILAVIVSMLGVIMSSVSASWSSATGRTETGLSARAIADYIQTDLAPALLPVNSSDQANLQFVLNPGALPQDYQNGDALFWQSPVANDTTYGDIAEVGYFIKWIAESGQPPKPILCRFFVEPTDPDAAASNYLIYEKPAQWLTRDVIDSVAPGTAAKSYAGLFAENVIGIWFRCFDAQGNPYGRAFDSRTAPADSTKLRLPCSVQVSFVVIDSRGAARLNTSLQSELSTLTATVGDAIATKDKTVSPAEAFVSQALANPKLKSIATGLKAHTTTVSLVNAR